jgi:hypothetical protein
MVSPSPFRLVGVAILVLLGLFSAPSPAAAAETTTVVESHQFFTGTTVNPCTLESIAFTAYLHTKVTITVSLDRIHTSTEANVENARGVAVVTGATYVFTEEESYMENGDSDLTPYTTRSESHFIANRLKEDGTYVLGDDFMAHSITKLTVDANGVTHADKFDIDTACR